MHWTTPDKPTRDAKAGSGGERTVVRILVALALARVQGIKLLCFDEPFAAMSAYFKPEYKEFLGWVMRKESRRAQLIVVTHDQSIAHLANNVIKLGD